jgi:ubiquinone/menaquinone biosynthesis C-methylase UbiE
MTTTAAVSRSTMTRAARKDSPIGGPMAAWYAKTTATSMEEFSRLARRIADELPNGGSVLEVAPGPGYFCIELAKLGPFVVRGVDLSAAMVKIAREKAASAGVRVDFEQGNAASLPFPQDSFDRLVCRAAFKNFARPVQALREMCRVLKPGGQALLIDLRGDASPDSLSRAVDGMRLSGINRMLTKLVFRTFLLRRAYTREQFEAMLRQTDFRSPSIEEGDIGFEIRMTK